MTVAMDLNIKDMFFDRQAVIDAVDKATAKALSRAGGSTRLIAQRSMRYALAVSQQKRMVREGQRKRVTEQRHSAPGEPPRAVKPHPWIRQFLYYAFDPAAQSVVVGPVRLARSTDAQAIMEYGGRTRIINHRRRIRRLGHGGEIRLLGDGTVQYATLRTPAQVARSNKINEQLYGPLAAMATIAPRPYMGPAMNKVSPTLASLWANSIR